jgi:hypothetical protein
MLRRWPGSFECQPARPPPWDSAWRVELPPSPADCPSPVGIEEGGGKSQRLRAGRLLQWHPVARAPGGNLARECRTDGEPGAGSPSTPMPTPCGTAFRNARTVEASSAPHAYACGAGWRGRSVRTYLGQELLHVHPARPARRPCTPAPALRPSASRLPSKRISASKGPAHSRPGSPHTPHTCQIGSRLSKLLHLPTHRLAGPRQSSGGE